ncbi:MAG: ATP-dependent helicase [bacterium]|nr:ATP-dependent helicase [bacterium]
MTPSPEAKNIDYEKELNPEQYKAVKAEDGPSLVLAGAGSGKTRVLTYRAAYLLERGISPYQMILLTFTQRAAAEMLNRVNLLLGEESKEIWGGTFHHIGNRFLRKYARYVNYLSNFTIIDREDCKTLTTECIKELSIDIKSTKFPKADILIEILSLAQNCLISVEQVIKDRYPFLKNNIKEITSVLELYDTKKKKQNIMDFDDLLTYWNKLLDIPEVNASITGKFKYILVDEYQDTNKLQLDIIYKMTSTHKNIMVVGDEVQSIYSFRGAEYRNIIEFTTKYPDAKVFKLETNYRSSPQVLSFANEIVKNTEDVFKKRLISTKKDGDRPMIVSTEDSYQQAEFVCQQIFEFLNKGIKLKQIAVLYRAHFQSMELEMNLLKCKMPYIIRSGVRFFERAHIKDVISYLKFIANPTDELAFKRIVKLLDGIGESNAQKIWKKISETNNECVENASFIPKKSMTSWNSFCQLLKTLKDNDRPSDMIEKITDAGYIDHLRYTYTDYQDRENDIKQLAQHSLQYDSTNDFLSEILLKEPATNEEIDMPKHKEEVNALTLSTVHRAKGLEWDVVFIISMSDGHFPISKAYENDEQYEEERRLFYVATTRAKRHLILTYPMTATRNYMITNVLQPSPFLQELSKTVYQKFSLPKRESKYGYNSDSYY